MIRLRACSARALYIIASLAALCACSQSTSSLQSKLALAQHAQVRDATFAITYLINGVQRQGKGELTTQPPREQLTVAAASNGQPTQLDIVTDGTFAFARVQGDSLWGQLNNSDDAPPVNIDAHIINFNQLSNVTVAADTKLAGIPTWHLHATFTMGLYDPVADFVKLPGTEDLWIFQSDGRPLREVKQVSGSTVGSDGTIYPLSYAATYDFTAWNTGIAIAIPGPDEIAPSG